jgi:hypothetical protein
VKWTGDLLFISRNPSGELELPEGSESEYRSLREALDQNGAEDALCPNWIPSDYAIDSIFCQTTQYMNRYYAMYISNRGELSIMVTKYESDSGYHMIEIEENGYEEYNVEGMIFIISSNYNIIQAEGSLGSYKYSFLGSIEEDEMRSIIQSLFR